MFFGWMTCRWPLSPRRSPDSLFVYTRLAKKNAMVGGEVTELAMRNAICEIGISVQRLAGKEKR